MKLCLKCYSLWPRDAAFCGKCRRALGARRCPKGHANPLFSPATTCLQCNEGPLDGVPCLPLGGLASLLTLLLLVGIWRWSWDHPGVVLGTLWRIGLWTLGVLFDTTPGRARMVIRQALAWYVVLWLLSCLLPRGLGRSARQALWTLPRRVWWGVRAHLRLLRPLLRRATRQPKAAPAHQKDAYQGSE